MQQELVDLVSQESSISKVGAKRIVDTIMAHFTDTLKSGESVTIQHFGTLRVTYKAPTTGRNPSNGEPIDVPEKVAVRFKAAAKLKDDVQIALPVVKKAMEEAAKEETSPVDAPPVEA